MPTFPPVPDALLPRGAVLRLGAPRFSPGGSDAFPVACSDGVVAAMNLGTLYLVDGRTGRELSRRKVRSGSKSQFIALAPDHEHLAWFTSSDIDPAELCGSTRSTDQRVVMEAAPSDVVALCFSPDARLLAVLTERHTLHIYDTRSGKLLSAQRTRDGSSPRGALAWSCRSVIACTGYDGLHLLYLAEETFVIVRRESRDVEEIRGAGALEFSADGARLTALRGCRQLTVWDVETASIVDSPPVIPPPGDGYSFSADLLAISRSGELETYALGSGERISPRSDEFDRNSSVLFTRSEDGTPLLVANTKDGLQLRAVPSGEILRAWKQPRRSYASGATPPRMLASPDGKWLALLNFEGNVSILDLATTETRKTSESSTPGAACFSPDGSVLALCSDDSALTLRTPKDGQTAWHGDPFGTYRKYDHHADHTFTHAVQVRGLGFARDGKALALCSRDGFQVLDFTAPSDHKKRCSQQAQACEDGGLPPGRLARPGEGRRYRCVGGIYSWFRHPAPHPGDQEHHGPDDARSRRAPDRSKEG